MCLALLTACATFDSTNILPGQRIPGPGFSFLAPTDKAWSASEYGYGHRVKLNQLNFEDSYSIIASLTKGPLKGMYSSAEAHLRDIRFHRRFKSKPSGYIELFYEDKIDRRFGELCIRETLSAKDWRGRNNQGPALIDTVTLTCSHLYLDNALVILELSRRYDAGGELKDLDNLADQLFSSVIYEAAELSR